VCRFRATYKVVRSARKRSITTPNESAFQQQGTNGNEEVACIGQTPVRQILPCERGAVARPGNRLFRRKSRRRRQKKSAPPPAPHAAPAAPHPGAPGRRIPGAARSNNGRWGGGAMHGPTTMLSRADDNSRTDRRRALRTRVARGIRRRLVLVVGWGAPKSNQVAGHPGAAGGRVRRHPVPRVVRVAAGHRASGRSGGATRRGRPGGQSGRTARWNARRLDPEAEQEVPLLRGPSLVIRPAGGLKYTLRCSVVRTRADGSRADIHDAHRGWIHHGWMETPGRSRTPDHSRVFAERWRPRLRTAPYMFTDMIRAAYLLDHGHAYARYYGRTRFTVCIWKVYAPAASTLLGSTVTRTTRG